jgi:hypothetical protein
VEGFGGGGKAATVINGVQDFQGFQSHASQFGLPLFGSFE